MRWWLRPKARLSYRLWNSMASVAIVAIMAAKARIRIVYRQVWRGLNGELCGRRRKSGSKRFITIALYAKAALFGTTLLCDKIYCLLLGLTDQNRTERKTNTNLLKHVFTFAFTLINVHFLHPWIYHRMATASITSARITATLTRKTTVRWWGWFHNT